MSVPADLLDCSICYNVLIDPVIGFCGHDFCKTCLLAWNDDAERRNVSTSCPLCRAELDVSELVVCRRLAEVVEQLHPERVRARRQEIELERRKASAAASRAAKRQEARLQGRPMQPLRVRRMLSPPPPSYATSSASGGFPHHNHGAAGPSATFPRPNSLASYAASALATYEAAMSWGQALSQQQQPENAFSPDGGVSTTTMDWQEAAHQDTFVMGCCPDSSPQGGRRGSRGSGGRRKGGGRAWRA